MDIELYDTNGTKFAHYNPNRGATVNMTGVNRPMPVFWKRLKVSGGSLVLTGIQRTDNRLEITAKAHLRTLSSKARGATRSSMETVDSKSIRIRVNTTQGNCYFIFLQSRGTFETGVGARGDSHIKAMEILFYGRVTNIIFTP